MGSMVLLDLMGGVALLLWGLHMVHSGILRAFGADLRLLLAKALNNRFTAYRELRLEPLYCPHRLSRGIAPHEREYPRRKDRF